MLRGTNTPSLPIPLSINGRAEWFHFREGRGAVVTEKQVAKIVKNGLVKAKQKARPDHELYRTIKPDPRPSKKQR